MAMSDSRLGYNHRYGCVGSFIVLAELRKRMKLMGQATGVSMNQTPGILEYIFGTGWMLFNSEKVCTVIV